MPRSPGHLIPPWKFSLKYLPKTFQPAKKKGPTRPFILSWPSMLRESPLRFQNLPPPAPENGSFLKVHYGGGSYASCSESGWIPRILLNSKPCLICWIRKQINNIPKFLPEIYGHLQFTTA